MLFVLLKSTAVLVVATAAVTLLSSATASTRRFVLGVAVLGALALPIVSLGIPSWGVFQRGAVDRVSHVAETILPPLPVSGAGDTTIGDESARGVVFPGGREPAEADVSAGAVRLEWSHIFLAVWLLGAALLGMRLLFGLLLTNVRLRRSGEPVASQWIESLDEAALELGLEPRSIGLEVSGAVSVPLVVGQLNPLICLPPAAQDWGRRRRHVVLLHEMAHIRNRDNFLRISSELLCALHWFNPFAWWVARRLRDESERVADDAVLEAGTKPTEYAVELVHIARVGHPHMAVVSAMGRPSSLKKRVGWILDAGRRRHSLKPYERALLWGVGVMSIVLLASLGEEAAEARTEQRLPLTLSDLADGDDASLLQAVADYYGVSTSGVELTIDEPLQGIVDDEVRSLVERYHPRSVSVVALDPCNGHVLALGGHGELGRSTALRPVEPGSTMKPITIAAAFEEGMSVDTRFYCENGVWQLGGRRIRDGVAGGWLGVASIVTHGSHIGTGRIYQQELGWDRLSGWFERFRLSEVPSIPLPHARGGVLPSGAVGADGISGVMAANGVGVRLTPIRLASVYAAMANHGVYVEPSLTRRVEDREGQVIIAESGARHRVMSEETAGTMMTLLGDAVSSESGIGRNARVEGLTIAGMSGTTWLADAREPEGEERMTSMGTMASFVGVVQDDEPQMVIYVGVEGVRGDRLTGSEVAAPAFARIVSRARGSSDQLNER